MLRLRDRQGPIEKGLRGRRVPLRQHLRDLTCDAKDIGFAPTLVRLFEHRDESAMQRRASSIWPSLACVLARWDKTVAVSKVAPLDR